MTRRSVLLQGMLFLCICLTSCAHEFTTATISKPDEYTKIYEAKERIVLLAVAALINEKETGRNVVIDEKNHTLESDFVESGGWRTRTNARVRQLNWKECELVLSVITEKKKKEGWEMQRLLGKDQYQKFFSLIEIKIYEEMSKVR